MILKTMNCIIASVLMVFICIVFVPITQAEQYDMTMCGSGTVTLVSGSQELTVLGTDTTGTTLSNLPSKVFDNLTYQCVGVMKIERGKPTSTSYCKFQDADGDGCVGEVSAAGTESSWKFLQGTGKWKGITGGGKNWPISKVKPIKPGTSQGCFRATGVYELPK